MMFDDMDENTLMFLVAHVGYVWRKIGCFVSHHHLRLNISTIKIWLLGR
jgi:hypothetical protein